jgi:hypothetical protein
LNRRRFTKKVWQCEKHRYQENDQNDRVFPNRVTIHDCAFFTGKFKTEELIF